MGWQGATLDDGPPWTLVGAGRELPHATRACDAHSARTPQKLQSRP